MSSTATPQAPVAVQPATANQFQFSSHSGSTNVTYLPLSFGPPIAGHIKEPSFVYDGPEGQLDFSGSQIVKEETLMGTVLSVVLKPKSDSGSRTFSLFLPPVMMGDSRSQTFITYAVKTQTMGTLVEIVGAQLTYEIERFKGEAEIVPVPL